MSDPTNDGAELSPPETPASPTGETPRHPCDVFIHLDGFAESAPRRERYMDGHRYMTVEVDRRQVLDAPPYYWDEIPTAQRGPDLVYRYWRRLTPDSVNASLNGARIFVEVQP